MFDDIKKDDVVLNLRGEKGYKYGVKVKLYEVPMVFPQLHSYEQPKNATWTKDYYSAQLTIGDSNSKNFLAVKEALEQVVKLVFEKQGRPATFKEVAAAGFPYGVKKIEAVEGKNVADVGQWFILAKRDEKAGIVSVFDQGRNVLKKPKLMSTDEVELLGNGTIVNASIVVQPYESGTNRGITFKLEAIQVVTAKGKFGGPAITEENVLDTFGVIEGAEPGLNEDTYNQNHDDNIPF